MSGGNPDWITIGETSSSDDSTHCSSSDVEEICPALKRTRVEPAPPPQQEEEEEEKQRPAVVVTTAAAPRKSFIMPVHPNFISIEKGWIAIIPRDLIPDDINALLHAKATFDELMALRPAEKGEIIMFGHPQVTPRYTQSYGTPYYFARTLHPALPVPPVIQPLVDWLNSEEVNNMLREFNDDATHPFNQILINWYLDGTQYIGAHSDDERALWPNSPIVSISLGATRKFLITPKEKGTTKKGKAVVREITLKNGQILVMGGAMQKFYKHEVTKPPASEQATTGPRINITLRKMRPAGN